MTAVKNAQTDYTSYFVMRDSTNHAPNLSVTVTDIDLYYVEQLLAISAKADCSALGSADAAHSDNGAYHVGKGLYRIDWPDAAFDGGIGKVVILIVECTGCDTLFERIELTPPGDVAAVSEDATAADVLEAMLDGTASSTVTGFPSSTVFTTNLSSGANDYYNGAYCLFTSGGLIGQARKISAYAGATKQITVGAAYTMAPGVGDAFVILGRSGT